MTGIGNKAAQALREGNVLAGKLRVERTLGEGGMGVVVAATHLHLRRQVAVKLVRPERADSRKVVQRFLREARAAGRLRSAHITQVLDAGELDDGTPYIVMELLEGQSLAELLRARGQLASEEAAELLLQACVGVAEAHAHGIVHRDLKPANLFVVSDRGRPHVKVLDFGISKAPPDADWDLETTIEGATLGSPAYMSPEQMRSPHNVDARTDVWSLGATLFHMLTGAPPFRADSLPDICVKVLHDPTPTLPDELEVPDELRAVITRCLAKERDERYASVSELAADLAQCAPARALESVSELEYVGADATHDATPVSEPTQPSLDTELPATLAESLLLPSPLAPPSATTTPTHTPPPTAAADDRARPRARRALALVGGALALAAAIALLAVPGRDEPTSPAPLAPATHEPAPRLERHAPPAPVAPSTPGEPTPAADAPATAVEVSREDVDEPSAADDVRARRPARDRPVREPRQREPASPTPAPAHGGSEPAREPASEAQSVTPVGPQAAPAIDPATEPTPPVERAVVPVDPADRRH